jgi:mitochondrial division protein 1
LDDAAALSLPTPKADDDADFSETNAANASFMSESIYKKLPSPKTRKHKTISAFPLNSFTKGGPNEDVDKGRQSMPILHEHFEPGLNIRDLQAHNDMITALDFDVPFGTMVTAALDDTVRVWDLNAGRCMGLLEGHHGKATLFK